MNLVDKEFTIKLTEAEVNTVVKALANEYKRLTDIVDTADQGTGHQAVKPKEKVRFMRNSFASLVNITYMGKDA